MKRFHVHAHVEDIQASIAFYSRMFAAEPSRVESDYAKLMLDDPRINFAISTRGGKLGVDHLGIQTDTEEELVELEVASFILNLLTSLRQCEEAPSSYPQPYPQLESCRQERVCQSHTGIAEVGCIARHHSQVVDQRDGGDLFVKPMLRVRYSQAPPDLRGLRIEGKDVLTILADDIRQPR